MTNVESAEGTRPARAIPKVWDDLHTIVQDVLASLTEHVLAEEPATTWKAGRTATRAFPLFSYRVFHHLDGNDDDPVVVGVTFFVRDTLVRISGDISGDESGFVYFDEGCTIDVPDESRAIRDAARLVSERLASEEAVVLEAIRNRRPRTTP